MTSPAPDLRWTELRALLGDAEDSDRALERVGLLEEAHVLLQLLQTEAAAAARTAGCSWSDLGKQAAITRQAAWQRWAPQAAYLDSLPVGQTSLLDE